jgi:hypothetical protein
VLEFGGLEIIEANMTSVYGEKRYWCDVCGHRHGPNRPITDKIHAQERTAMIGELKSYVVTGTNPELRRTANEILKRIS